MERIIREALPDDMPDIMAVIDAAKGIMRQSGNMHQWGEGYPSETAIIADMENHGGFVVEDDDKVVGYFAFLRSPEPTYAKIYKGKWLDDAEPYHVVHRIASYPDVHGIFSSVMEYCFSQDPNIRIDTHRDNRIMQHNIAKHGFSYCGIIYLASGDERLAYQRILTRRNHCDMEMSLLLILIYYSITIILISMSSTGLSARPVAVPCIISTTSRPSSTSPNTVY